MSRGGARPGAGRKATGKRKRLTVSLPADLSERVLAVAAEPSQFVAVAVEALLASSLDDTTHNKLADLEPSESDWYQAFGLALVIVAKAEHLANSIRVDNVIRHHHRVKAADVLELYRRFHSDTKDLQKFIGKKEWMNSQAPSAPSKLERVRPAGV